MSTAWLAAQRFLLLLGIRHAIWMEVLVYLRDGRGSNRRRMHVNGGLLRTSISNIWGIKRLVQ